MKIVISIPAYNEARTIVNLINNIKEVMNNTKYNYQILVVDDGSRDDTAKLVKTTGAIVYSHQYNYGLAETFRTEIQQCLRLKADVIVHIDADNQYLPKEIPKLIEEIKNGYDLVLGSRFLGHIEDMPLMKRWGNRAFSRAISKIIKQKITDCQTGFRAFTKEVAEKINIMSTYTYTQEQIIRAVRQKFKIKEIPVYFAKRKDKSRLMKNPFHYAVKAWVNIFRIYRDYEPLKFFGIFGTIFFGIGFLIGLWLTIRFLIKGSIGGHVPSLILAILLILMGIQVILFGFLADTQRK